MDVTMKKAELAAEVALCASVAARKGTLAVMTCVRLSAEPMSNTLDLAATDIDISVRTGCPATITAPGAVVVSASKLDYMVGELPDGEVSLSMARDGKAVMVKAGRFSGRLLTMDLRDYPNLPAVEGVSLEVSRKSLVQLLRRVVIAVGEVGATQGLLLTDATNGMLRAAGTDGHRLSVADCVTTSLNDAWPEIVVPRRAAAEVLKLLRDSTTESVTLTTTDRALSITVGARTLFARLLDTKFPAFERVIPKGELPGASMARSALASAVRRVISTGGDAVRLVTTDGQVELRSQVDQVGDSDDAIAATNVTGEFDSTLVARYVLQYLDAQDEEEVRMATKDSNSAVLWTVAGDETARYVVMPRRL